MGGVWEQQIRSARSFLLSLLKTHSQSLNDESFHTFMAVGKFQKEDLYTRKYWRRVQQLANEFWCQRQKEALLFLQERQKWNFHKQNFMVGDIVLLKVDANRNN